MIEKLLIATGNQHKLAEIRAIFNVPTLELFDMNSIPDLPEVVEDRDTFKGNATGDSRSKGDFSCQL